ncbi:cell division protein FtsQ/DivIB [Streptomyces albus]|uniref:cell division protein FtsQ/DivIB n=1 Tax=Streptomyces TaxID=1883 RepID=UPI00034E922A|nr:MULTISPECIES: FtsQ-type POTRA domain-containing protein [Streptomyces]EPD95709.1 hypothetical protein HMPREF1486_01571 [Streptomyces sp. HPH0547]UVN57269.1 FtsQ-type POTRA domain-containing protein [Streptomyces albus]GHJ19708.1 hypothetical protein TPA0909_13220 [Streptomyces albus]
MVRAARTAKSDKGERTGGTGKGAAAGKVAAAGRGAGTARPVRPRGAAGTAGRATPRPAAPSRGSGSGSGSRGGRGNGSGDGETRPGRWLPKRRTLLLVLALLVPLCGFGLWALYGSSWLRAENVSVGGTRVLSENDVTRAAAVPLGDPLISIDKGAVRERVRRALPRVRDVTVERSWPHDITLTVTERRPELVMESAGKYVEVDVDGVRFATVGKPPKGVPVLVLQGGSRPAREHFSDTRLRREAARVAAALPEPVRRATRVVRVRSYDDITLELTGKRTVGWGSSERAEAKATALTALMKAAEDATHFDVSAPSAPAASDS